MPSTTHTPADIRQAFAAVGREITPQRAAAITAKIVEHGFDEAIKAAFRGFDGKAFEVAGDIRTYVDCRMDAASTTADLISRLEWDAQNTRDMLAGPYPTARAAALLASIEARIGRLVALTQAKAA